MDLTAEEQRALGSYGELVRAAQRPAAPEEIGVWCEFILSRYRSRPDTPAFADLDKHIWLTVLGHWPLPIMLAAVVAWCSEKRPFPPAVPGEVLALAEPIYAYRAGVLKLIEKKLAIAAGDGPARGAPVLGAPAAETLGPVAALAGRLAHG